MQHALSNLTRELPLHEELVIVVGYDPERHRPGGVDEIAYMWAMAAWIARPECHPAEWEELGKAAGFIRNQEMVDSGANLAYAFIRNQSRGATHCSDRAYAAGIPVRYWRDDG